jgi:hypothetical protein
MTELANHPLSEIFPLIDEDSFVALKEDIAAYGLHEPLWLYEGQILDGRNRYRACRELGLDCPTRPYTGDDPLGFMLSMNLHRRHLNESQRAMMAAKIATMRQGERTDVAPSANSQKVSQAKAAEMVNISVRTLADAKKVQAEAQPEVIRAVEAGHIAVSAAAKLAQQPVETQREVTAKVTSGEAKTVEQAIKQVRVEANGRSGELRQPRPASNGKADAERRRAGWQHQLAELRQHFARLEKGERVEALVRSWDIAEASGYVIGLGELIEHLRHVHLRIMTVVSDQVDGDASFLMARRLIELAESILYELAHWRRWVPRDSAVRAFDLMEQHLRELQDNFRIKQAEGSEPAAAVEVPANQDGEKILPGTPATEGNTREQALSRENGPDEGADPQANVPTNADATDESPLTRTVLVRCRTRQEARDAARLWREQGHTVRVVHVSNDAAETERPWHVVEVPTDGDSVGILSEATITTNDEMEVARVADPAPHNTQIAQAPSG